MGRPKLDGDLRPLVTAYLADAVTKSATDRPISYDAIARAVDADPRTVKTHFTAEIRLARIDQKRGRSASRAEAERRGYAELLAARDAEVERLRTLNLQLVARWALVEANAVRLGVDAEELLRPTVKPDRTVSRAGAQHPRSKRAKNS